MGGYDGEQTSTAAVLGVSTQKPDDAVATSSLADKYAAWQARLDAFTMKVRPTPLIPLVIWLTVSAILIIRKNKNHFSFACRCNAFAWFLSHSLFTRSSGGCAIEF